MIEFWVHRSGTDSHQPNVLLGGDSFSVRNNKPSYKASLWNDRDDVLAFCRRSYGGWTVTEAENRITVTPPADTDIPHLRPVFFDRVVLPPA